jgi:hypothetical protein
MRELALIELRRLELPLFELALFEMPLAESVASAAAFPQREPPTIPRA